MDFKVSFSVNEVIYLRNPETTELGKKIVKSSIDLIYSLGFESFTFKKLALEIGTTEATIYRYFENKQKLLLYILNWYWSYMEFMLEFKLQNVVSNKEKLETIISLLTNELPESIGIDDYNKKYLNQIVITESSKVYLVKEVSEINKDEVFKPFKDLCSKIADVVSALNPNYLFPRSLSSTIIETSHDQQFFSKFLPRLTDVALGHHSEFATEFLNDLVFKVLA